MAPDIVIEISGAHGGELENCLRLIRAAKQLKPASIKFQFFNPWELAKRRHGMPAVDAALGYHAGPAELAALYEKTRTPQVWLPELLHELDGYPWSASVFSMADLDFVMRHDCPQLKLASFEIAHLELFRAVAATGKPVVFSASGAADVRDIFAALEVLKPSNTTILHATRYYYGECSYDDVEREKEEFGSLKMLVAGRVKKIGLSDHTHDNHLARWCTERGVDMIEVHLALADVETPDSAFALNSEQIAELMEDLRAIAGGRSQLAR